MYVCTCARIRVYARARASVYEHARAREVFMGCLAVDMCQPQPGGFRLGLESEGFAVLKTLMFSNSTYFLPSESLICD